MCRKSTINMLTTAISLLFLVKSTIVESQSFYNTSVYISPGIEMADFNKDVLFGPTATTSVNGNTTILAEKLLINSSSLISGTGNLNIGNPTTYSLPWADHTLDANGVTIGCKLVFNTTNVYMSSQTYPGFTSDASFDVAVSQEVAFINGIIHTGSAVFHFLPGSSHSGSGTSSFVGGNVSKTGNTAFTFPVGSGLLYAPASITAPALISDKFLAAYHHLDPHLIGTPLEAGLHHISHCEYWTLDRQSGSAPVSVTLSWDQSRSCGVDDLAALRVGKWNGSLWENKGNVSFSGSAASGTILSSPVTSFSPFTLSSVSEKNPLPVAMTSFSASCHDDLVLVSWKTLSEQNSSHFECQYSTDMSNWNHIETVPGAGNSNHPVEYSVQHRSGTAQTLYYRLIQKDLDGVTRTYGPVSTACNPSKIPSVFPNPVGEFFTVSIPGSNEAWDYEIYDSRGVLCMKGGLSGEAYNYLLSSTSLAMGAYRIVLRNAAETHTLPFVKVIQ